jgi:hypothetical protein
MTKTPRFPTLCRLARIVHPGSGASRAAEATSEVFENTQFYHGVASPRQSRAVRKNGRHFRC